MFLRINTVDKAIAPLLKAQKDLEAVFDERSRVIEQNYAQIVELQTDNTTADAERKRAARIRDALLAITESKE